jgi:hypothetical protein
MTTPLRSLVAVGLLAPLAAGCASRVAPFNEMDKAQITVLRLQGQEQPQATPAATTPSPVPGLAIPGLPIPPELQQLGQGVLQALPPGLIPPGLIPGAPAGTPQPQVQPQLPRFPQSAGQRGFVILASMPLQDDKLKNEILDIFGSASSFQPGQPTCFYPGMGVAMMRPGQPEVDLMISLSCNQAMGDGFRWPHPANNFTPDTHNRLTQVYEKLWGPVPPGA